MIHEYSLAELFTAIEYLHVFKHRLCLLRVTIEKMIEDYNAYVEWVMQKDNFRIGGYK